MTVAAGIVFLPPWVNCPAATASGEFDPGSVLHSNPPVVVGTYALDVDRIFTSQMQMVRREATQHQREVAEANARAFMAAQIRAVEAEAKQKKKKPDLKAALAKLPRYVAVDTVKDARSVPGTKKDVMVWDTQSAALVDNSVYDVSNPPAVGASQKFDTRTAEYVGNGLPLPEIGEGPPRWPRSVLR
ncbi:MAG: hypothetical protein ABJC09_17880 [Terriglobia bacterium]